MRTPRIHRNALGVALLLASFGCADDDTMTGPHTFTPPPGAVDINFSVDDSANQTYTQADGLAWKGSFSYDAPTRILTRNPAWPGPYVLLWDDGPWTRGGHEPEEATADDHVWGVTVFMESPEEDLTLEYGVIRGSVDGSDGEWIWTGSNGLLTVQAGETDALTADGLTIRAFGTTDLRLTLDSANLAPSFGDFDSADRVRVKSSVWGWREIDAVDDGTKGDEMAGDGRFTFVLGENVGEGTDFPHAGLLHSGDQAEFIFVLAGIEYRVGNEASSQGVGAATRVSAESSWSAAPIGLSPGGYSVVTAP
jgi:hypothetical protein